MLNRLFRSARKVLPVAALALVVAGGFAWAVMPQPHQVAHVVTPQTPSPSPVVATSTSASPESNPAVAGAETAAPEPTDEPTLRPTAAPAAAKPVAPPAQQPAYTLVISLPGVHRTASLPVPADACTALYAARAAGVISSVTISDQWAHSAPLYSLYVEEINGVRGVVFELNGARIPWGCTNPSAPHIKAGDTLTWKQA